MRKLKLQLAAMAIVIGMRPIDETDSKMVLLAGEFKPATGDVTWIELHLIVVFDLICCCSDFRFILGLPRPSATCAASWSDPAMREPVGKKETASC